MTKLVIRNLPLVESGYTSSLSSILDRLEKRVLSIYKVYTPNLETFSDTQIEEYRAKQRVIRDILIQIANCKDDVYHINLRLSDVNGTDRIPFDLFVESVDEEVSEAKAEEETNKNIEKERKINKNYGKHKRADATDGKSRKNRSSKRTDR